MIAVHTAFRLLRHPILASKPTRTTTFSKRFDVEKIQKAHLQGLELRFGALVDAVRLATE